MNIIQITDTHLFKDDNKKMYGVNTNFNFYQVIDKIKKYQSVIPDCLILTGDISQDESRESYQKIVKKLEEIGIKTYWIPGNHDNIELMESVFSQSKLFYKVRKISFNYWDFVFLNTKIEHADSGFLHQSELTALETELNHIENTKNVAIIMHHHPIEVKTPLIDRFILKNSADFFEIIKFRQNVKLIICGHVHGDYSLKYKDIHIESSPATCLQWKIGTSVSEIQKSIGFKVYTFYKNNYSCFSDKWDFH